MGCTNKTKSRCGSKVYAVCVNYEGSLPEYSSLDPDNCIDIQEVAEDIYEILTNVKADIDTTGLDFGCLDSPTVNISKNVLQLLLDTICDLKSTVDEQADTITTMQEQITYLLENNCPPAP